MPDRHDDESEVSELKNLYVREISLVDRAANKREFLLFKSDTEGGDRQMPETLTKEQTAEIEEALNTELDSEDDVMKSLEAKAEGGKLSPKALNAAKAAARLLGAHPELGDVLKGATEEPKAEPKVEPKPKPEVKPEPKPEPAPAAGDPVEKAHLAELAKRDVEITELKKQVGELVATAKADKVEKFVDELDLPSMSREDQIAFVAGLNDDQHEMVKAWSDGLHASMGTTQPAGTPRRGETVPESASDELMKRATGLVEKDASGKLDLSDALLKVRAADPALTERVRQETLGG